jgi:uncharacterized protein (TIGR00159 family)
VFEGWPIGPAQILDVSVLWLALWAGIAWLRTTPARLALPAVALLAFVYIVASQPGLVFITWLLQGLFAVSVLVTVVVFQQELRRLFEQIGSLWPPRWRKATTGPDEVDTLVRALATLAQQKRGALVVIQGQESLESHIDGGVLLDAQLSEPLLLSLFDPHSPGHDGAIVVDRGRITRFAVHLPLSMDREQLGLRGTRHAAGLGLSERCDGLAIVVSEERGTISIAEGGRLEQMAAPQLVTERVRAYLDAQSSDAEVGRSVFERVRWRDALVSLPLALAMWLLVVPGSSRVDVERSVPVRVTGLPPSYALEAVEPPAALVRLSGLRRDLLLLGPDAVRVEVDAILVDLGRRTFDVSAADVVHPDSVAIVGVTPASVKIRVREATGPGRPAPAQP